MKQTQMSTGLSSCFDFVNLWNKTKIWHQNKTKQKTHKTTILNIQIKSMKWEEEPLIKEKLE